MQNQLPVWPFKNNLYNTLFCKSAQALLGVSRAWGFYSRQQTGYLLGTFFFWGPMRVLRGCAAEADGNCSSFVWRCTRRSECRRAEEKNGWLWSPRQQCVKIVSFYPPNLSCKKTQKVQRRLSSLSLSLALSLCSLNLFPSLSLCSTQPHLHAHHTNMHSLSNKLFPLWIRDLGSKSSYSVLIHPKNSTLAYYNWPGWLCSQPEDGEPLSCSFSLKLFFFILFHCFLTTPPLSESQLYTHQQNLSPFLVLNWSPASSEENRFLTIPPMTNREAELGLMLTNIIQQNPIIDLTVFSP